jgi:predicted transposase/invertase (TIGR01784 family)
VRPRFLDHVLFPQAPGNHLRFRLLETEQHFPFTADLFHVLELPKFTKSAAELVSGLDVWLYFLPNAERMDPEALPPALGRPLMHRACEELKMLSQTDQERERYEARCKWQLDYNTGMKVARMEGREEGEQFGRIHLCERLLRRPETPTEQLAALPLEEPTPTPSAGSTRAEAGAMDKSRCTLVSEPGRFRPAGDLS